MTGGKELDMREKIGQASLERDCNAAGNTASRDVGGASVFGYQDEGLVRPVSNGYWANWHDVL